MYLIIRNYKVSISGMQSGNIFVYDKENENTYPKWKVFQCIVAEIIDENNICYILYNGLWRRISTDFKQIVSDYFTNNSIKFDENILKNELTNNINIYDTSTKQNREEIFNQECVKLNEDLFLFDKAKIEIANEKNMKFVIF